MGSFDYRSLRDAAWNGGILGKWSGYSVFSASKDSLDEKGSGAFYILYDDDNKIVKKDSYGTWKEYGEVDEFGNVNECYVKKYKRYTEEKTYEAPKEVPAADLYVEEEVIGDVKTDIDVDKVLKSVSETTIDDLLKGFNYGL